LCSSAWSPKLPLKSKVAIKVTGQLHSGIVFEVAIQELDDGVKGRGFLAVIKVEGFHKSPSRTLKTADDILSTASPCLFVDPIFR
jgi:hypothetical protein